MSSYTDNFPDSNEQTLYQLDITSENGEAISYDDISDQQVKAVIALLEDKPDDEA